MFLFIDGPALVCGWVSFPILWPHPPVQTKLKFKCPGQRSSQEPQNKQPDTVKRPLKNTVVSGFRIVDLEFLLFHLMNGCQNYQKNISLCDIEKETKRGLAYILYIKCNECKSLIKSTLVVIIPMLKPKVIKVMKEETTFSTSTLSLCFR